MITFGAGLLALAAFPLWLILLTVALILLNG